MIDDVASTTENDLNERPKELLQQLTLDGFIAYPYKYGTQSASAQLRFLSKVLDTTKLLFIDWNLENFNPDSPENLEKQLLKF